MKRRDFVHPDSDVDEARAGMLREAQALSDRELACMVAARCMRIFDNPSSTPAERAEADAEFTQLYGEVKRQAAAFAGVDGIARVAEAIAHGTLPPNFFPWQCEFIAGCDLMLEARNLLRQSR